MKKSFITSSLLADDIFVRIPYGTNKAQTRLYKCAAPGLTRAVSAAQIRDVYELTF